MGVGSGMGYVRAGVCAFGGVVSFMPWPVYNHGHHEPTKRVYVNAVDIIAAAQPIIVVILGFWKWRHGIEVKERTEERKAEREILERMATSLEQIRLSMTVNQERFDNHHKEMVHNFNQIRTAQAKVPCELNPTVVEDLHDAAKQVLRTRTV